MAQLQTVVKRLREYGLVVRLEDVLSREDNSDMEFTVYDTKANQVCLITMYGEKGNSNSGKRVETVEVENYKVNVFVVGFPVVHLFYPSTKKLVATIVAQYELARRAIEEQANK